MNAVQYTNARREGRTQPGLIEVIGLTDPRHRNNPPRVVPNRATRRASGVGIRKPVRLKARRRPFEPTTTDS